MLTDYLESMHPYFCVLIKRTYINCVHANLFFASFIAWWIGPSDILFRFIRPKFVIVQFRHTLNMASTLSRVCLRGSSLLKNTQAINGTARTISVSASRGKEERCKLEHYLSSIQQMKKIVNSYWFVKCSVRNLPMCLGFINWYKNHVSFFSVPRGNSTCYWYWKVGTNGSSSWKWRKFN